MLHAAPEATSDDLAVLGAVNEIRRSLRHSRPGAVITSLLLQDGERLLSPSKDCRTAAELEGLVGAQVERVLGEGHRGQGPKVVAAQFAHNQTDLYTGNRLQMSARWTMLEEWDLNGGALR